MKLPTQTRKSNPKLAVERRLDSLVGSAISAVVLCVAISALSMTGCAKWIGQKRPVPTESSGSERFKIRRTTMAKDSVSLELGIAQLLPTEVEQLERVWKQLDSQKLSLSTRKLLDENGIRMALVSSQVPGDLHALLEPREIDPERLNSFQKQMYEKDLLKPSERLIVHKRIQNRDGEDYRLDVSLVHPQKSWVVVGDEGRTAGAAEHVQGIFNIQTYPQGDGSVRVRLTPKLSHGQPRPQIGVVDRSFLIQHEQATTEFADLAVDMTILPGEAILIGGTPDMAGLADLYFKIPMANSGEVTASPDMLAIPQAQRIVLIRLVQTQHNDLFDSFLKGEKLLSTPHE